MTRTTKEKTKKAKRQPSPDKQQTGLSPAAAKIVSAADEDPAVIAAREAADAAAAFNVIAATADENAPEVKAAQRQSEKADAAFADTPVTSAAGALVKMREIAEMAMSGQYDEPGLEASHFNTVVAFLEMEADAPVIGVPAVVVGKPAKSQGSAVELTEPDPAVAAGKEAQEAATAWSAYAKAHPTRDDEKTPEYRAVQERSEKADDAFSTAPVTSLAGALTKLRALAKDITEDRGPTGWDLGHVKTVTAYLEELADKTGIALIDLPAEDIASVLADKSWADRAHFFNNAIVESLESLGIAVEDCDKNGKEIEARAFLDACMLMMHGCICKVLDIWGLEVPPDEDAARVFALSASRKHRDAAYVFCGRSQDAVDRLFKPATGLTVFKRMSELSRPGLTEWWRKYIEGPKTAESDPAVVAFTELKAAWTAFDTLSDEESRAGRPESPEYVAAYERYAAARDAVRDAVPISLEGVTAKVRALLEPYRADADAVGLDHDYDISAKAMLLFLESDAAALLDAERLAGVS